jgi:hypothetical protein
MRKYGIMLLSIIASANLAHAGLTVKNENVPLDLLSPKHGMMSSSKNQPALFDLPAAGQSRTYNLSGNYFDFFIMPAGREGIRCFLIKEDEKLPYDERKGIDIRKDRNTTIAITLIESENKIQCKITQR